MQEITLHKAMREVLYSILVGEILIKAMRTMIEDPEQIKLITLLFKAVDPKKAKEIKRDPELLVSYLKQGLGVSKGLNRQPEIPNEEVISVPVKKEKSRSSLVEITQEAIPSTLIILID